MNCGHKNSFRLVANLKTVTCKKCGALLSSQNRTMGPISTVQKTKPVQVVIAQDSRIEGEYKQYGVLCLYCKTVTPFGNKRCQNCKKKLRINPRTTVYYNGIKEAVQCPKCGKYTSFKGLKCEHCKKKLK